MFDKIQILSVCLITIIYIHFIYIMEKEKRCEKGTRKKNGKCVKGSNQIINGKKVWVFEQEPVSKFEKGTRKRCPRGTIEVTENNIKYCISKFPEPTTQKENQPIPEEPTTQKENQPIPEEPKRIPCGKRCPNKMRCKKGYCEAIVKAPPIEAPPIEAPPIEAPPIEAPIVSKKTNKRIIMRKEEPVYSEQAITEMDEYNWFKKNPHDFFPLYPNLNDPNFNIKLSEKKEFNDIPFDNETYNVEKKAENLCSIENVKKTFEYLPHQLFVRNFLSLQTPYNSLLLYHSVGTGKTLSAISIAEDMRTYLQQLGIRKKIIIVAAPNVQKNFKRQIFDDTKLKETKNNDEVIWTINSGIGNALLKDLNGLKKREEVIQAIDKLIRKYYKFYGYGGLANKISKMKDETIEDTEERNEIFIQKIHEEFDNSLIIIDEVHNIRITNDNADKESKKAGEFIQEIAQFATNVRFVLLSATPIYNSFDEIIYLTNLMNVNDGRAKITKKDVFDDKGEFKQEGGKDLLIRKLTGYISFVRGENPYTFPYRIYPSDIPKIKEKSILKIQYPTIQLNGKLLTKKIQHLDLVMTSLKHEQNEIYRAFTEKLFKNDDLDIEDVDLYQEEEKSDDTESEESFVNLEEETTFRYTALQLPLQALNIVYPSGPIIENSIGQKGFNSIMTTEKNQNSLKFEYKEGHEGFFSRDEISKYSSKISDICDAIEKSKGIVLVYAYYIWGGIVPLALALEERGFNRYSSNPSASNLLKSNNKNAPKYLMITGDSKLSHNNAEEVKYVSDKDNTNGENVKVILISKSGSEGLDFKNIRQIHIMDPWYTLNRIEQIIGRGVRTLSHCVLPFEERNVEIYLYASLLPNEKQESADLYLYRYAERKAVQLGKIYRLLKQISIDCILNQGQQKMSVEYLKQKAILNLSSGDKITYKLGDKPFSTICDYMETCDYQCRPHSSHLSVHKSTYTNEFIKNNNNVLTEKIKSMFRDSDSQEFTIEEIVRKINISRKYPLDQIYYALTYLIKDKREYLVDSYGRLGNLVNKDKYYLFQPLEITDTNASLFERNIPVDYKPKSIVVPSDYKHSATLLEVSKNKTKEISEDNTFNLLLEQWRQTFYNNLTTEESSNKSWNFNVIEELQTKYKIDLKEIQKFFIFYNLDRFSISEKLALVKINPSKEMDHTIGPYITSYFENKKINQTIVLYDPANQKNRYYRFSDSWNEIERETFQTLIENDKSKYFSKFKPKLNLKQNFLTGFLTNFKKTSKIVFFTIDNSDERNRGIYFENGSNLEYAYNIINTFLENNGYTLYSEHVLKKNQLAVIFEILLRHKKLLLSPEQYYESKK
jgi:superfamily II DNA or RNA helicase